MRQACQDVPSEMCLTLARFEVSKDDYYFTCHLQTSLPWSSSLIAAKSELPPTLVLSHNPDVFPTNTTDPSSAAAASWM